MKVWISKIETEDCEEYYLGFNSQPTENQVKKEFFKDHGNIYEEEDWGVCISHDIFEVEVI